MKLYAAEFYCRTPFEYDQDISFIFTDKSMAEQALTKIKEFTLKNDKFYGANISEESINSIEDVDCFISLNKPPLSI
jgi:hypothetical protein